MCRRRTRIVRLPPRALLLPQDMHEEGGGEGKKDAEESLMVCTDCVIWGYRGRLAPIVMLPKEFAGTVIKVTKSGVIKSIKAVESSARGLTSNNGAGEAEPRGAIQCLSSISGSKIRRHNSLPRSHPASSSGPHFEWAGWQGSGASQRSGGAPRGISRRDGYRAIHPSRTSPPRPFSKKTRPKTREKTEV